MTDHIFMILMDVPAGLDAKFNHLYDYDHLGHMMKVPGNLHCDRYRLDWSDDPGMLRYLCLYDIADPGLPRSDAWKAQAGQGSWATEMRPFVTTRRNGVFRRIAAHGQARDAGGLRDCIYFLQQAIPAVLEERFNHLYDADHIPLMLQAPGVSGCTRYRLEYSDTDDVPDYLAVYTVEGPEIPRSAAWKAQNGKGAWPVEMRPKFTARRNGAYSLIAAHPGTPAA